jgi:hypothetical protein
MQHSSQLGNEPLFEAAASSSHVTVPMQHVVHTQSLQHCLGGSIEMLTSELRHNYRQDQSLFRQQVNGATERYGYMQVDCISLSESATGARRQRVTMSAHVDGHQQRAQDPGGQGSGAEVPYETNALSRGYSYQSNCCKKRKNQCGAEVSYTLKHHRNQAESGC